MIFVFCISSLLLHNVLAVPELRSSWVGRSEATGARNSLLYAGSPFAAEPLAGAQSTHDLANRIFGPHQFCDRPNGMIRFHIGRFG